MLLYVSGVNYHVNSNYTKSAALLQIYCVLENFCHKFANLVAPHGAASKNRNIGAQLQSLTCIISSKKFRKIYFLYDFWCAQTCSFRAVFWTTCMSFDNCCQHYNNEVMQKILYRCTSTFSWLNYCGEIFFKSLSYLHEVVRANFTPIFDFSHFLTAISRKLWPHLATKMRTM